MKTKLDETDFLRMQNLVLRFALAKEQIGRAQDEATRIQSDLIELQGDYEKKYEFSLEAGDKLNPATGEIERAPKANGKGDTKEATA